MKDDLTSGDDTSSFYIEKDTAGIRLDKLLMEKFPFVRSRTYFHFLFESKAILVDGEPVKKSYVAKAGEEVEVQLLATPEISLEPENIALNILFEDEEILVINKPAGMVVHPAPGHYSGTLVNALLYYLQHKRLFDPKDLRPGIVHRLDKGTSGALVIAKTPEMHGLLVEMFSKREVYKEYAAIVVGKPQNGQIRTLIGRHPKNRQKMAVVTQGGKEAISTFETVTEGRFFSLVRAVIQTGRTHQIRVHLEHQKTPILGDALYGFSHWNEKTKVDRPLLHAKRISFHHPKNKTLIDISAPFPDDFLFAQNKFLNSLGDI